MARPTRQQRRERRAAQAESAQRQPPRRPPVRPGGGDGSGAGDGDRGRPRETTEHRRGIPGVRFVRESWAELRKVEWPGQHQVITGTMVVLIACIIVGAYLYLNDVVWKHVVQNFLIK
jgi:preprotein translocase SecE subunit